MVDEVLTEGQYARLMLFKSATDRSPIRVPIKCSFLGCKSLYDSVTNLLALKPVYVSKGRFECEFHQRGKVDG